MQISSSPGYQLLNQSNHLIDQAATDIQATMTNNPSIDAVTPSDDTKLESLKPASSKSSVDPLINLNQAQQYAKVGSTIIQREQDMIGTLLDTSV